jgi:hypothetical protein
MGASRPRRFDASAASVVAWESVLCRSGLNFVRGCSLLSSESGGEIRDTVGIPGRRRSSKCRAMNIASQHPEALARSAAKGNTSRQKPHPNPASEFAYPRVTFPALIDPSHQRLESSRKILQARLGASFGIVPIAWAAKLGVGAKDSIFSNWFLWRHGGPALFRASGSNFAHTQRRRWARLGGQGRRGRDTSARISSLVGHGPSLCRSPSCSRRRHRPQIFPAEPRP